MIVDAIALCLSSLRYQHCYHLRGIFCRYFRRRQTGLTAVTTGVLFLLALFTPLAPIGAAIAALELSGLNDGCEIDFDDFAFRILTIAVCPFLLYCQWYFCRFIAYPLMKVAAVGLKKHWVCLCSLQFHWHTLLYGSRQGSLLRPFIFPNLCQNSADSSKLRQTN